MNEERNIDTPEADPEYVLGRGHGHKPRERKDIASGEAMNPVRMIRLGFSPDGDVVADVFGKLPGRGAWVAANRGAVEQAIKAKAFARAAKRKVAVPDDFADVIERQLAGKVLGLLRMANRAGQLESGFDKVKGAASADALAFRLEASDGAEDGRGKIRVITKAIARDMEVNAPPVIGCFTGAELGQITGREHLVHGGVRKGRLARSMQDELSRLAGFRALIPESWPDKEHEPDFHPFGDKAKDSGI